MSKVYIEGIRKLPKSCHKCRFRQPTSDDSEFQCKLLSVNIIFVGPDDGRALICPLREVKDDKTK